MEKTLCVGDTMSPLKKKVIIIKKSALTMHPSQMKPGLVFKNFKRELRAKLSKEFWENSLLFWVFFLKDFSKSLLGILVLFISVNLL